MIRHLNKRERVLFFIVIAAGTLMGINAFISKPLLRSWTSLSGKVRSKELKLSKYLRLSKQENIIKREFAKYADSLNPAGSDEELISLILQEIEQIGRNSNIMITDIKSQPIQALRTHKELIIDTEIDAPMQNLTHFLYNLRNSPHIFVVEKLHLAKANEKTMRCYIQISKIFFKS